MDVTVKELFNFPAGVDVVHIGIQNDLEHHLGVVRAATAFLIQLSETFKIQALNQGVNHVHRIVFCNILINSLRKKNGLVGIVRTKMYLSLIHICALPHLAGCIVVPPDSRFLELHAVFGLEQQSMDQPLEMYLQHLLHYRCCMLRSGSCRILHQITDVQRRLLINYCK